MTLMRNFTLAQQHEMQYIVLFDNNL